MNEFLGYEVGVFINDSPSSLHPQLFSFKISDSIYSTFPSLDLYVVDSTGFLLEYGNYTQGVPINIKYGNGDLGGMIDADFRSVGRDNVGSTTNSGGHGLTGRLAIKGIHDSFFENREALNLAFKDKLVSDVVKSLFEGEEKFHVESTKGKIEAYSFSEPYFFTRDVLIPQAAVGDIPYPFLFFRQLDGSLHFASTNKLESNSPASKLYYGGTDNDSLYNNLALFLPYNEGLDKTLNYFNASGLVLCDDLAAIREKKTIDISAKHKIPVIGSPIIENNHYFHRQFNPAVDYDQITTGLFANAMLPGYFVDKALARGVFRPDLFAGKTVEVFVAIGGTGEDGELSETFSSNWLIEQSHHIWNGQDNQGMSEFILCRSSVIPHRESLINDLAFSGEE